ncbi:hypothetical protein RQP46_006705 [Phenoliferia psychrophenolica]
MPSIKSLVYSALAVSLATTVSAAGAPANRFVTQVSRHHAAADPLSGVLGVVDGLLGSLMGSGSNRLLSSEVDLRAHEFLEVPLAHSHVEKRAAAVNSKVDYGPIVDSLDEKLALIRSAIVPTDGNPEKRQLGGMLGGGDPISAILTMVNGLLSQFVQVFFVRGGIFAGIAETLNLRRSTVDYTPFFDKLEATLERMKVAIAKQQGQSV